MGFGVTLPALKKIAGKPTIKSLYTDLDTKKRLQIEWLGAEFKNIETLGERSAAGLNNNNGAILIRLTPHSLAEENKLQKGDVIIKMGDNPINSISDLIQIFQNIKWMDEGDFIIIRNQAEIKLHISFK